MTNTELTRRAEAAGISVSYTDWRQQLVQVPPETLAAILDALGDSVQPDARDRPEAPEAADHPAADPPESALLPRRPEERIWGFAVQLYSLRSRQSWGHGDLHDLAELARWSARALGAGFIMVNPLHAAEPLPPVSNSPYLPMTRRYVSPLYISVDNVPEYQRLTTQQRQQLSALVAPLLRANHTPDLIDRDHVWTVKRQALELIFAAGRDSDRQQAFDRYNAREGDALADWSHWCALAEIHGADWRCWPAEVADPRRAAAAKTAQQMRARAPFHMWLQWIADEQLAQAQQTALHAGMSVGLIADLAVGVHPGGADAWARQDLLVRGISVGAPPDEFNQRGQSWAQPPFNPARLASSAGRPFAELLAAAFRHVGGLRMDHVMSLMRLWWIPEGRSPEYGAYVRYDHRLMAGTLAREAARAGAMTIGEDLGTIEPWIRRYLEDRHILGTEMAWFARDADGSLLSPARWRRWCMATVGTHDVPPIAGYIAGDQITVRDRLGLVTDPQAERTALDRSLADWRVALGAHDLLPRGRGPSTAELIIAFYGYLARTPSRLIGVALADAVGDRRTQNIPGTSDEYPNWRIPLCNADGEPVLLEDLASLPLIEAVAQAVTA